VLRFLLGRLGSSLLAVTGVSLLVFFFLHLVPGDPVDNLAGGDATPEQRQDLMECMNLHESIPRQLVIFVENIGNGTLGRQCPDPKGTLPPVSARIARVLPYTVELAVAAVLLALVLALPLGVIAAARRGSWIDGTAALLSLAGISMPVAWMGPVAINLFFLDLGWLPGPMESTGLAALVLPAAVLAVHLMAMLARMTRSSLLDVLGEDYLRTARAKGLAEGTVVLKHGLRNALLPVITVVGMQFGSLLAGAVITEKVFARPGMGTLIFEAIKQRNYPMIQGCVLVLGVMTVLVNLAVDLTYGLADPRIRRR
jgi:ABC-type dipeptide/oligopeptide/nickel transport system permease component